MRGPGVWWPGVWLALVVMGLAGVGVRGLAEGGEELQGQPGASAEPIRIGVPYMRTARGLLGSAKGGGPDGFAVQVTREALRAVGIECRFVALPAGTQDLIGQLNRGKDKSDPEWLDAVVPLSISEERINDVDFSVPLVTARGAVVTRVDMPVIDDIEGLRGKRVIVARRGAGQLWCVEQGIECTAVESLTEALAKVAGGEQDYLVTLQMAAKWEIEQSHIVGLKDVSLRGPEHLVSFALAGHFGDERLTNRFNRGLSVLRDNGRYDQLYRAWVQRYQPVERPPMVRLAWLNLVAGLAIALLSGAAAWQVVMYRRLAKRTRMLRESEAALRQITDALDQVVWLFDLRTQKQVFMSPAFERVYGLPVKAMQEDPSCWRRVVHPDDLEMAAAAVEKGNRDPAGCDVHYRVVKADGSVRWIHDRAVPLKGPDGELEYVAGIAQDVTELREMQEAVREREGYYRSLFENSNDAFMIFEPEGERILSVNDRACVMYGYTAAELTRLSMEDLSTNVTRGKERIEETMASGTHDEFITQHRRRDGTLIDVEIRAAVIEHRERRVILSVNRDVTERRQAEEARRRLDEQVMQSQKVESLGVLVGGVAHDFNNLLAGVLGNAGVAIRGLAEGDPARRNLEQIQAAATRAADLTRNMLAYAGEGRITPRPVDLAALVRDTLTLVAGSIARSATVRVKAEDGLPLVECDAAQVSQVIMNLVLNASDALADRHGMIEISTRLGRPDAGERLDGGGSRAMFPAGWTGGDAEMVCLEVRDEGCGIAEEIVPRIFDPFFTTKFAGRGLGLAAVLGIVRQHGGVIGVSSEQDSGSTFRVWFPALAGTAAGADGADEAGSTESGGSTARAGACGKAETTPARGTLLVVDDERMVLEMVAAALEGAGFSVVKAHGGAEALRLLREGAGKIDGVLLDLTMPEVDGEQVLRAMRAVSPGLPVVLMSGYGEKQVMERLAGVEVKSFLPKPFRLEDLIASARGMVERAAEVTGSGAPVDVAGIGVVGTVEGLSVGGAAVAVAPETAKAAGPKPASTSAKPTPEVWF